MNISIALQLFSVRDDMASDFKGTLQKVKDMGYDGVEFALLEIPLFVSRHFQAVVTPVSALQKGADHSSYALAASCGVQGQAIRLAGYGYRLGMFALYEIGGNIECAAENGGIQGGESGVLCEDETEYGAYFAEIGLVAVISSWLFVWLPFSRSVFAPFGWFLYRNAPVRS